MNLARYRSSRSWGFYAIQPGKLKMRRYFGQPASQTHPHILKFGEVVPGITKEEIQSRRNRLMEKIAEQHGNGRTSNHIVIVPSASQSYMSYDIPYPFRQNTDFLYLCGFQEPDSILVMEGHADKLPKHISTLFVPKKEPQKELWDGPRSGTQGAVELTGVDRAENIDQFSHFLELYKNSHGGFITWYDYKKPPHAKFHAQFIKEFIKQNKVGFTVTPKHLIQSLRLIKSPIEVELMVKTCKIASEAFAEVMRYSYSGVNESHLYAKMDFECRTRGAEFLAYPPVVAGGNRANIIHYVSNNQFIHEREMVLMDAGCECHGYTSDITRTWPVSGQFTDSQREVYEALLEVQQLCIKFCCEKNINLEMLYMEMLRQLAKQLQRLKMIPQHCDEMAKLKFAKLFCPHHVGHYLGMDVHDTDEISRHICFQPGIVITVEPGIYIPEDALNVPAEFRGMGIRIEDDILITSDGPRNLTSGCPKLPGEIESAIIETTG